jgi:trans-aconitate methyltransferase
MSRTFADLYLAEAYPAMSHPSADPAVNAEVAQAAGLACAEMADARILEIGCGTGHHILSLANRWPGAEWVGVDISAKGISRARRLASEAGLKNGKFCECSILEYEPEGEFECIIAHGVFSWVPDEVKIGLVDFIGKKLAPNGIAVMSFNVAAGWKTRMPVVEKVKAIQELGDTDEMTALSVMKDVADETEAVIIDDMLAKGAEVLAFDDFAPVMDAWSLGAVVKLAEASGLKWLGDSVSGERGDDAGDNAAKRTFRSELFCRADAVLSAMPGASGRPKVAATVPDFPKLDSWRLVCARECLPLPDAELKPCMFTFPQFKVLAAMDGKLSVVALADHAKQVAPDLDFISWLRHVAERGLLT